MSGQKNSRSKGIVSTCIACGVSAVLLLAFFLFVFAFGGEDESAVAENHGENSKPTGTLAFTADTYEIETNQDMDMGQYLQCEGEISAEDVTWSSDSDALVVGSKGHIVVNDYGAGGTLRATSNENDEIMAECVVKSRSQEDDFVYQVEALNGEHGQDETTEDGVVRLAYSNTENQTVDISAQTQEPGERNKNYAWDKDLFYTLEEIDAKSSKDGQINSYWVEKKKFISKDSGNEVEYEIYHNPDNDKINKIVSIEYKGGRLDITEYYYTDKGKVNFVYVYEDINYTPSYATPDRDGERFLFHKDTLVTWRIVKNKKEINYCCGEAEKKRVTKSGRKAVLYADCSDKRKKKYDKKEKEILNAAYNTLEKVTDYEGVSTISGYLDMASGEGLEGASVELMSEEYETSLYTAETNEEGYYELVIPSREAGYWIKFVKEGYLEETLYDIEANIDEINLSQEVVYLSEEDYSEYDCELVFYDALYKADDGMGMALLDGVQVVIRRGVNNRSGEAVFDGYASESVQSISLAPGMYTVQISRTGYADTFSSLFVSAETGNSLAIYATPQLADDEYRIVLTWDAEPYDLDSHLFAPPSGSSDEEDCHICYYHMSDEDFNTSLDVDDVDGFGPETTTINHIRQGQYKFYVCDFTNCSQGNEKSSQMSNSSAAVRVYGSQGLVQTFYVPVNRSGVIWEVFEIRDGTVIPSQRYYDAIGNRTWWSAVK